MDDDVHDERQGRDGVLTPEELDVGDDEHVTELDGNRYFVSLGNDESPEPVASAGGDRADAPADDPGGVPDDPGPRPRAPDPEAAGTDRPVDRNGDREPRDPGTDGADGAASTGPPESAEPSSLAGAVADARAQYAVAVAAKTERGVAEHRVETNNVAVAFEDLLRWYAGRVGGEETPPEEVLEVLLDASGFDLDA